MIRPLVGSAILLFTLTTGCVCSGSSTRLLWPQNVPPIRVGNDIEKILSKAPDRKIWGYARILGFASVGIKRAGIFGWKDLGMHADAIGWVRAAVTSTDRYLTIDVELSALEVDGKKLVLDEKRFLRSEVCLRRIKLPPAERPKPGHQVRIAGRLVWDADGWLEVHPEVREDIDVLANLE